MLRRLYHFFVVGHVWEFKYQVWNRSYDGVWMLCPSYTESFKHHFYGFTDFHFVCGCGAHKCLRIVGECTDSAGEEELSQLRKMVGL